MRSQQTDVNGLELIDADTVLFQWWQIANADPNELTQLRRFNCDP